MDRRERAEFSFALGATGEPNVVGSDWSTLQILGSVCLSKFSDRKGLMLPNDRTAQKLCLLRT
jgi:hypothetical protein